MKTNNSLLIRNKLKVLIIKVSLFCLGRAFQSASKFDKDIRSEIFTWENGYKVMFQVLPNGPYLCIKKENNYIRYCGLKHCDSDLIINVKNLDSAFLVFTAQLGTAQAYAEHRMSVKGDIGIAMSLIRCLNIVQAYLFPKFIAKNVLKTIPAMPLNKHIRRFYIYFIGIPLGI